jgi:hypothetical protein
MSDTPRTIAAIQKYRRYGGSPQDEPVFSSDMVELERELAAATRQRDALVETLEKIAFMYPGDNFIRRTVEDAVAATKP